MDAPSSFSGGELPEPPIAERFARLQENLVPLWKEIGRSDPGGPLQQANVIVVIPSLSADVPINSIQVQAYEERFLFMLYLLRQPNIHLVYVTSQPIQPAIIDYYLDILPGVVISSARKRLHLVSPNDGMPIPLSRKLLDRPYILEKIRALIRVPKRAHIVPFNTTDLEREVAVQLGIPMYAADPSYVAFGTKSGGRQVFAEEGVPHPLGVEDIQSEMALVEAVASIRAQKPAIRKVIAKLNEGVGGMGNAIINLGQLPPPGGDDETTQLTAAVRDMQFEFKHVTYPSFMATLEETGGIVEEHVSGQEYRSPSAQLRVTPLGDVEMLSTHDQILGGPSGQTYLGARFPADPEYSWMIMREAVKIGRRFAREGIVGRFAVDFVVVRSASGAWDPYAIEINLRKGGTTAPYLTLQYLTDGNYDAEAGVFTTARGAQKCYVASDHIESPAYRVFTVDDLFDIISDHRLQFDQTTQKGVLLHMMSGVGGLGQFGATVICDTPAEADALYGRFLKVLDEEARLRSRPLEQP